MATFVDEQMKRALMEKFRHVAIYCALGGIVAKAYPSAPDETGAPTSVAVEWIQADKFYPISFDSNGTVTSAVFVQYKTLLQYGGSEIGTDQTDRSDTKTAPKLPAASEEDSDPDSDTDAGSDSGSGAGSDSGSGSGSGSASESDSGSGSQSGDSSKPGSGEEQGSFL